MSRPLGTYNIPTNFETKIAWTLDARSMVQTYADLLTFTADNYIPNGFLVSVYDVDTDKRGIYICIDNTNLSSPSSWLKIGGSGSSSNVVLSDVRINSNIDFNFEVPEKNTIITILIFSENSDTINIGTTDGGDEITPDGIEITNNDLLVLNRYFNTTTTLYVTGITGNTIFVLSYKSYSTILT